MRGQLGVALAEHVGEVLMHDQEVKVRHTAFVYLANPKHSERRVPGPFEPLVQGVNEALPELPEHDVRRELGVVVGPSVPFGGQRQGPEHCVTDWAGHELRLRARGSSEQKPAVAVPTGALVVPRAALVGDGVAGLARLGAKLEPPQALVAGVDVGRVPRLRGNGGVFARPSLHGL